MAETALIPLDLSQLPSTQIGTDDDFAQIAKGAEFLGRLQLFTKGKAINKGLVRPGHYGIPESDDEIIDLGDCVDILPLARRTKAIDMSDNEAIVVSYDFKNPEFQRIQAAADTPESGCMFGPSFLVIERSSGRFLEFFCGNKSSRGESKKLFPYLPLSEEDIRQKGLVDQKPHGPIPVTLKSKLVEKRSFSWHAPVVVKCSTPFTRLPANEVILREITKFLTIKDNGVEKAKDEGRKQRAR